MSDAPESSAGLMQRFGTPRTWGARIWLGVAAATLAAVTVSATGVIGSDSGTGDPASRSGAVAWDSLQAGNCFVDDAPTEVHHEVTLVACSTPHNREVVALRDLGPGAWPGEDAVDTGAEAACYPAFEAYVGVPPDRSSLLGIADPPAHESWDHGDHVVVCLVAPTLGRVTGSLEGADQ